MANPRKPSKEEIAQRNATGLERARVAQTQSRKPGQLSEDRTAYQIRLDDFRTVTNETAKEQGHVLVTWFQMASKTIQGDIRTETTCTKCGSMAAAETDEFGSGLTEVLSLSSPCRS